eukprot:2241844-Rhodomonas_salina.1
MSPDPPSQLERSAASDAAPAGGGQASRARARAESGFEPVTQPPTTCSRVTCQPQESRDPKQDAPTRDAPPSASLARDPHPDPRTWLCTHAAIPLLTLRGSRSLSRGSRGGEGGA